MECDAGYTITFMGSRNGRARSASSSPPRRLSDFQHRKSVVSLGQRLPRGNLATVSKHARRSKALPTGSPPRPHRTSLWFAIHSGIRPNSLPRGPHKNLDEAGFLRCSINQRRHFHEHELEREAANSREGRRLELQTMIGRMRLCIKLLLRCCFCHLHSFFSH